MIRGRIILCTGFAALIGVGTARSLAEDNRPAPGATAESKYELTGAPRTIREAMNGGSPVIAKQLPEGDALIKAIVEGDSAIPVDLPGPHGPGGIITGFETPFVVGPIEPQQGWAASGVNLGWASISTANPSPGAQHLRMIANTASGAGVQQLVFSPALPAQPAGSSVFSIRVNISNDLGADYEVIGQAPSLAGPLTWRVRFRFNNNNDSGAATPPGTIFVLDDLDGPGGAAATFQNTGVAWLEGTYANLRIEFNPTGTTTYFYNGNLIYSDTNGAAPLGDRVEQIVLLHDNFQNVGETADFDQLALTPTTTTGACCNLVSGCTGSVLHSACAGATDIFFPNQTCAQITCGIQGACCLPSGVCTLASSSACTAQMGIFRGNGTVCDANTCNGSCCTPGGGCSVLSASACEAALGIYRGPDTQCPAGGPACPAVCTFTGPNCHDRDNADALNATAGTFAIAEDFIVGAGQNTIGGICVFGAYIGLNGNLPIPGQFTVTYRSSVNGLPGPVIAGGGPFVQGTNLTLTGPAPTGDVITGTTAPVFSFQMSHANVVVPVNTCTWVEVSNDLPDGNAWFWVTSIAGNLYLAQDGTPPDGYDPGDLDFTTNLAFCLNRVLGDDNVCAAGACCIGTCFVTCQDGTTQTECGALGGSWAGPGTNCIENCQPSAPCCRGDLQPDGNYNGRDIQLFVNAIVGGTLCENNYPLFCAANVNEDASLNAQDVPGFVTLILNGGETIDRCCGARLVTCNSTTVMDNTLATTSASDPEFPCAFGGSTRGVGTVWARFVATETTAQIDTEGSTGTAGDSLLALYAGNCNGFAQLGCDEDSGTGLLSKLCVTGLTPGQTFYIQLASFDEDNRGAYNLNITCPCPTGACCVGGACSVTTDADCKAQSGVFTPGVDCTNHVCPSLANVAPGPGADLCAAPRPIACGQVHTVTPSAEGLVLGTEPDSTCEIGGGGPFAQDSDWWYVFTSGPTTTLATVSLCGFTADIEDTVVTMYTPGSTCAALVELTCDDDSCTEPDLGTSQFTATVTPNTQYLIRVEHYSPASPAGTQYTIGIACH